MSMSKINKMSKSKSQDSMASNSSSEQIFAIRNSKLVASESDRLLVCFTAKTQDGRSKLISHNGTFAGQLRISVWDLKLNLMKELKRQQRVIIPLT